MIAIAPTHQAWFNQLRTHPHGKIVNFWTPTPWNVRKLKPGDLFYFLLKAPIRKIGGFGHFVGYETMRSSQAWSRFGLDNGVFSFDELTKRTAELVEKNTGRRRSSPDPEIGCILLSSPVFAPEAEWIKPDAAGLSFPRQIVKLKYFPKLSRIRQLSGGVSTAVPESLDKAASATLDAEDGQGFVSDAAVRKAIERRAMDLAKEHYGALFDTVDDTSATESYDLRCTQRGLEVHVEVKGSTGVVKDVLITAGEVEHAMKSGCQTDLFAASSITLSTDASGTHGHGGTKRILTKWKPVQSDLTPLLFRYHLPSE
jgi:hypothetical protein